ncbi:unnamed protein product [Kuraishia capsulata CBS 1993]|uniref:Uncharacterized protein n=1 Tax=Kuraishia capsulata CBS 1993 TaxID=1382522 RepID=W6MWF8_9ASCO|nr:uncharacterized protein KUCA_T00003348001 [Kuraishia capsulata CBS 1993]CDK27370.1 unnamed protein product [Kuraishia capsulata CBS 1993]
MSSFEALVGGTLFASQSAQKNTTPRKDGRKIPPISLPIFNESSRSDLTRSEKLTVVNLDKHGRILERQTTRIEQEQLLKELEAPRMQSADASSTMACTSGISAQTAILNESRESVCSAVSTASSNWSYDSHKAMMMNKDQILHNWMRMGCGSAETESEEEKKPSVNREQKERSRAIGRGMVKTCNKELRRLFKHMGGKEKSPKEKPGSLELDRELNEAVMKKINDIMRCEDLMMKMANL